MNDTGAARINNRDICIITRQPDSSQWVKVRAAQGKLSPWIYLGWSDLQREHTFSLRWLHLVSATPSHHDPKNSAQQQAYYCQHTYPGEQAHRYALWLPGRNLLQEQRG